MGNMHKLFARRWVIVASASIAVIIIGGLIFHFISHASTPFIATEPESGTVKVPASKITDTTASGGVAIKFAPSSSCIGSPTTPADFAPTTTTLPSVELNWSASKAAANCSLAGYKFWRADGKTPPPATGTPYSTLTGLTYNNIKVEFSTTYSYTLIAYDTTGHQSAPATMTVTTPANPWVWPVHKEDLNNSTYGLTQCWLHYYSVRESYHAAMDIGVKYKPVYAPHKGTVVGKFSDGYNTLIINSGKDPATDKTLYATFEHMSAITVSDGDAVTKGQQIGTSGEVGAPGQPHLHFGISDSETYFGTYANPWHTANPLDFLPDDYSDALERTSSNSCKTATIKTLGSSYGFSKYKTNGTFDMYK